MALSSLDILSCEITVGDADPQNVMNIKNPIVFREVEHVTITESYKQLIGTAKITFPKGTVYQSTILQNITLEGKDARKVTTEVMENGLIVEKRKQQNVIGTGTFKVGQRITIKLGYNGILKSMFDGYITAYNSDSSIEIECENLAYGLKLIQAPKIETPDSAKVNDILGEKYGLLKGSGFEIHSETKRFDICIGKVKITDNFTVADVLNAWSKYRVYCFLKYDEDSQDAMPKIAIGRPYSSFKTQPVFPQDNHSGPFKIYFDYHVAENHLKVLKTDPKFLAVTAKALGSDEKLFEVTVRLNPDYDVSNRNSKEFQVVNATQISTKRHKVTGNTTARGAETKTKVDLSTYTIVPYMSPNLKIDSDTLVEEGIEYFKNYNLNGITGYLTVFGDFGMPPGVQAELIDERNPSKNGIYLVEEVTTSFGTGGYRQKLKLPYKIKGETSTYGNGK